MEWTIDRARETDQRVRRSLTRSRADLIQFVAEGGWRMLPDGPSTAAAYVQDAAGVKRSEAYRIVATARISLILLSRMVEDLDADSTGEPRQLDVDWYAWILREVIRSTHVGEYLCSITHEVITDYETRLAAGVPAPEAVTEAINAHPRPADDQADATGAPGAGEPAGSGGYSPTSEAGANEPGGSAKNEPEFPDVSTLERAERVLICPHCGKPLR